MCNGTGNPSRRSLLGMALAGVAGNLPQALGAAGTGNRFLVSIYLLGGSDGDSLIVRWKSADTGGMPRFADRWL